MRFALFALVIAACSRPAPLPGAAGPAEAVQAFSDAVHKGDAAAAWSLLSSQTQKAADALAARSGAAGGREMLFGSAVPAAAVNSLRVASESGDSATVTAMAPDGGTASTFHAVRENGRWRVDLPLGH